MLPLNWTGERLVTSVENEFLVYEHLHRYAMARIFCKKKIVLDIACGEGYGSYLISETADFVYGVDIDEAAILHAKNKYKKDQTNLIFETGSTSAIPLQDNSVDIVVSFETLEHHAEHDQMFREIKRVLKDEGMLIISTPDKRIYNQRSPNNPFHIKELYEEDFKLLLEAHFGFCRYYKQARIAASLIIPVEKSLTSFYAFDGSFTEINESLEETGFFNKYYFNIGICSDSDENELSVTSVFNAAQTFSNQRNELIEKGRKQISSSTSYKVGSWLVSKFYFLKKIWLK